MKRKNMLFTALGLLISLAVSQVGCQKTEDESELSPPERSSSESATQAHTKTNPSAIAPTEPSETNPIPAEPDEDYKNDIIYRMSFILDMTYGEIVNLYPEVEVKNGAKDMAELTCEQMPGIKVLFAVAQYDEQVNPISVDMKPCQVELNGKIYPELKDRGERER